MKHFFFFLTLVFGYTTFAQTPDSVATNPVQADSVQQTTVLAEPEVTDTIVYERINFYQTGLADGKKLYTTTGPFWGGFTSGFVLNIFGAVPSAVIAAIPPDPNNIPNPNHHLLAQNKEYYSGFKKGIHDRKLGKTAAGFGVGIASITVLYLGVVFAVLSTL